MKKLMIAAFAIAFAAVAQAAVVQWKYTGVADDLDKTVYVMTSAIQSQYATVDDLLAFAISEGGSGVVTSKKVGPKTSYLIATQSMGDESLVKGAESLYAVIIADGATEFKYGTIATNNLIYDPANQETASGVLEITSAMLTSTGTIGGAAIPEPTSALMLLVGLAGVALKRKVA